MDEQGQETRQERLERIRRNNLRTAAWVGGLALFFFVMLFVNRLWLH